MFSGGTRVPFATVYHTRGEAVRVQLLRKETAGTQFGCRRG